MYREPEPPSLEPAADTWRPSHSCPEGRHRRRIPAVLYTLDGKQSSSSFGRGPNNSFHGRVGFRWTLRRPSMNAPTNAPVANTARLDLFDGGLLVGVLASAALSGASFRAGGPCFSRGAGDERDKLYAVRLSYSSAMIPRVRVGVAENWHVRVGSMRTDQRGFQSWAGSAGEHRPLPRRHRSGWSGDDRFPGGRSRRRADVARFGWC